MCIALVLFSLGCTGCTFAKNMSILNISSSITDIGGGGLMTLATVINSDIIKKRKRGLFQSFQNLFLGFGSICGASLGGPISGY